MKLVNIIWLSATLMFVLLFAVIAFPYPVSSGSTPAIESTAGAAELFSQRCASCHGRDGRARGLKGKATGARNLTDGEWQDRVSDERIFNSINNGKGKMPAFGKKLSEAEVDSLVQYVRSLKK